MSQPWPPGHGQQPYEAQPLTPAQEPPPAYGHPYAPQQPPMQQPHARPAQNSALAIVALCVAVVGALTAFVIPLRGVAIAVGLLAVIVAIAALALKSRRTGMAVSALVVGVITIPLAVVLMMADAANERAQQRDVNEIAKCVSQPDLTADEIWECAN